MKTITAVECKGCRKLIDSTKVYMVADEIRLTHKNLKGPIVDVTAVTLKDEAFCDVECLIDFLKKDTKEVPF